MQAIICVSNSNVSNETLKGVGGQEQSFLYCCANIVATFRIAENLESANINLEEKRIRIKEWNKFCYHIQTYVRK